MRAQVDWRVYFNDFCEAHGHNAILYRGRLTFADGWTYSSTSYAGPEWPPPEGEALRQLMLAYWTRRCIVVTDERDELQRDIQNFKDMSHAKSVPMRFNVPLLEGDAIKAEQIGFEEYMERCLGRLDWLNEDVARCHEKLNVLRRLNNATSESGGQGEGTGGSQSAVPASV